MSNDEINAKLDLLLARVDLLLMRLGEKASWLVQGRVFISEYMVDGEKERKESMMIQADTEEEAMLKFEQHWNSKTEEYETYYHACADTARKSF